MITLAKHSPTHIYFTGRNVKAANAVIAEAHKAAPDVGLTFLECDFTSLASVQAALKALKHSKLDILICNAGVMAQPLGTSKDGYEIHLAINHLANALVIRTLLPKLLEAAKAPDADVRIVNLTSVAWRAHPAEGVQFSTARTTQDLGFTWKWRRYGQSKLANIVYAAELARRYGKDGLSAVSVHPGVVNTGLVSNLGAAQKALVYVTNIGNVLGTDEGVKNQLWAAAGAKQSELVNGAYYMPVGENANSKLTPVAKSETFGTELWEWTEKALAGFF